ncbi:MAG TPA: ATP-binding protein [Chloroflexota bacterium]
MMKRLQANLWAKLLAAHLLVLLAGGATLLVATLLIAPALFDHLMTAVTGPGLRALGHTMTPEAEAAMRDLAAAAFRQAEVTTLLLAMAASVLAAIVVSVFVSGRIASTVGRMTEAARRIASGRYSERVPTGEPDDLGKLAVSFNAMAESLERDERRRLELIGTVAHELRTPISNIRGYLEGVEDGVVPPSEETWGFLISETGRLGRLVEDLQELSRAEAKQLPFSIGRISPLRPLEAATSRLRAAFEEKGVSLETALPPSLPDVLADEGRVIQVVTNLLANALRYSPSGAEVKLTARAEEEELVFEVADTGIGIASEHLPHLFERFYRVDRARTRAAGGSGIGLTIARSLVVAMGGRIWAESAGPGKGSIFTFTLPRAT